MSTKIKIDQIEKTEETSFTRLKKHEYNYATQFLRDGWYPFRNVKMNNVDESVKKAKRI